MAKGRAATRARAQASASGPAPVDAAGWELYVLWAYRLLLGRDPEDSAVLGGDPYNHDRKTLVRHFLASPEFQVNNGLGFSSAALEIAKRDGYSIYAPRDDQLIGSPILHGSYEPHVTAVFRKYLKLGMNVVDVGANVGHFSMLAASIVGPRGLVTSVEANPDNARLLEASRRLNGFDHVRLACVAAGRELGVLLLDTDVSNGVTTPIDKAEQLWTSRIVPCVPLPAILPQGRPVDFIKIDIEGAEYGAMLACADLLRRDQPVVVSEFSPAALMEVSGVDAEVYLRFLLSCGFELAVVQMNCEIVWYGNDAGGVVAEWTRSNSDHIDIIAAPPSARSRLAS